MVRSDFSEDTLFLETGWEVCWQLGGIYTVLRSKAPVTVSVWGDNYALLGPYNKATASVEFEETEPSGAFGEAVLKMREAGFKVHFGRWLITGSPQVILIDFLHHFPSVAEYKYYLWKDHYIESGDDQEVNDVVLFGYLAAEYIQKLTEILHPETAVKDAAVSESVRSRIQKPRLLAMFHEWMAGVPVPEIARRKLPVATIFHTHATLLGRYLAPDNPNFYEDLKKIDPYEAAKGRGIYSRFAIERAAAWSASVFTTLSEITATEAEHFLARKPDMLLPNGLNIHKFAATHEFQNLHGLYKQKIHDFVMGHFFSSYQFDLDKTVYLFTSGRYEFQNKGFNLYIEALARLNARLIHSGSDVKVVAFLITRAATHGIRADVLKSRIMYNEIREACSSIADHMGDNLLKAAVRGRLPEINELLDETFQMRLKRLNHAWKRSGNPPNITHDLVFTGEDPILNQINACRLYNQPENPVKIIYHPEFLNSTSPLFGLDYDQFVRGCHLGVFPSFYEPWGYTPMECAVMGIPSVTSDLAGFSTFIQSHMPDHEQNGLMVIRRNGLSFHESADLLTDAMEKIIRTSRRDRIELRNRVESTSDHFDWKNLYQFYVEAQKEALRKFSEKHPDQS